VPGEPGPLHTVHRPGDVDYFGLHAPEGAGYLIRTFDLGGGQGNDTVLWLYYLDGVTPMAFSDDHPMEEPGASRIEWQSRRTGTYYIAVLQHDPAEWGCDLTYRLEVIQTSGPTPTPTWTPTTTPTQFLSAYLPLLLRDCGT
jgi:hypothetical protein